MTLRKWLNAAYLIVFGVLLVFHLSLDGSHLWTWFALIAFTFPASLLATAIVYPTELGLVGKSTWIGTAIFAGIWVGFICMQLWLINQVVRRIRTKGFR